MRSFQRLFLNKGKKPSSGLALFAQLVSKASWAAQKAHSPSRHPPPLKARNRALTLPPFQRLGSHAKTTTPVVHRDTRPKAPRPHCGGPSSAESRRSADAAQNSPLYPRSTAYPIPRAGRPNEAGAPGQEEPPHR